MFMFDKYFLYIYKIKGRHTYTGIQAAQSKVSVNDRDKLDCTHPRCLPMLNLNQFPHNLDRMT